MNDLAKSYKETSQDRHELKKEAASGERDGPLTDKGLLGTVGRPCRSCCLEGFSPSYMEPHRKRIVHFFAGVAPTSRLIGFAFDHYRSGVFRI